VTSVLPGSVSCWAYQGGAIDLQEMNWKFRAGFHE
jgi:hypothetical protein